jgi:cysteine desulfurase
VAAQSLGGGQERRRRAGTENTLGIASFGAVMAEIDALLRAAQQGVALRDTLEAELRTHVPAVQAFGAASPRLFNTSCFALPGVLSPTQIMTLDLAHIAVSAGSACSSGKVTPSHVLLAMGVPPEVAACAIRVSLGWNNTADEISRFIAVYAAMAEKHARAPVPPLAAAARS